MNVLYLVMTEDGKVTCVSKALEDKVKLNPLPLDWRRFEPSDFSKRMQKIIDEENKVRLQYPPQWDLDAIKGL